MATARLNGVRLYVEEHGEEGVPMILVHGSWDSHEDWEDVVPALARPFRVITYDRRGHSASERQAEQGSIHEDVADLAALIDHLDARPAWLTGNSFGATIALRLAAESPSHVAGVVGHEPPALSLARDDASMAPILDEVLEQVSAIVETIAAGDHTRAAREWIDSVVHEPGAWAEMPRHEREILIENAPTFLDEANDPEQLDLDLESLSAFDGPILVTAGRESLPLFPWVVQEIADAVPSARRRVFSKAGHVPHVTHPDEFVQVTREFVQQHA